MASPSATFMKPPSLPEPPTALHPRGFTAACTPPSRTSLSRIGARGRSPATRCHSAISSGEYVPAALVIAKNRSISPLIWLTSSDTSTRNPS